MERKVRILQPKEDLAKQEYKRIQAEYDDKKEFRMDPKGYFLVRVNKDTKTIEIALCKRVNQIEVVVEGKNPREIYQTAIKEGLVSRLDHAAYLGRELQKAFMCLNSGQEYVQDDDY